MQAVGLYGGVIGEIAGSRPWGEMLHSCMPRVIDKEEKV